MSEANATIKTIEHLEASRLPEPTWFWRRWLIYGVTVWTLSLLTASVCVLLWIATHPAQAPPALVLNILSLLIRYSFYTAWAAVILYGVGASVTDVASLASAVRTTRKETITTAPPPATLTSSASGATKVEAPAATIPEKPSWK